MIKILLVTGPAGAGKTTACNKLAESCEGMWAYISQDDIRQYIKAGFKSPADKWTDDTEKQWDVSIAICADMARRYQETGINCVIDGFAPPPMGSFDKWEKPFEGLDFKLAVLLPDVETTVKRNAQRTGNTKLKESQIRNHHAWFSEWANESQAKIIDSSSIDTNQVVDLLKTYLDD